MKKQDLNNIKKEFKIDEVSRIRIKHIASVYIKNGEEPEILHTRHRNFSTLEVEEQALYMRTFKKVLSGNLNKNLFELRFTGNLEENPSWESLNTMLEADSSQEFLEASSPIVDNVIQNFTYKTDIALNFIQFQYENEDTVLDFVLGTVNKSSLTDMVLGFDYTQRDFNVMLETVPVVNLKAPLDGFFFPMMEDNDHNVNKVLNYHSKSNKTNIAFITEVLKCDLVLTAIEEKEAFTSILKRVMGRKIKTSDLHSIYNSLHDAFRAEEDSEDRKVPQNMLVRLLEHTLGVTQDQFHMNIETAYEESIGQTNYQFSVDNIVPDFKKKSVNIKNQDTEVLIGPKDLNKVQQVKTQEGDRFVLIRITDDVSADGLHIDEDVATIHFGENNE